VVISIILNFEEEYKLGCQAQAQVSLAAKAQFNYKLDLYWTIPVIGTNFTLLISYYIFNLPERSSIPFLQNFNDCFKLY
jgi:hypothetical protein